MYFKETTFEKDGWQLESAVERHKSSPDNFEIPDELTRTSLKKNDFVKLLFLFMTNQEGLRLVECERMWVTVIDVLSDGYEGVLESVPAAEGFLELGDVIHFKPDHVASIFIPETDSRHPNYKKHSWKFW